MSFHQCHKPCICKKSLDNNNSKYSLKEGDIFYRYGGRSERIRYTELESIIDKSRNLEETQWLDLIKRVAHIGISNAAVLDLKSGNLSGANGSVVIDGELLNKLAFIKEGSFVETDGTPTLRLIGDIKEISTGKVVLTETTKKIVRAIEPSDIVRIFLENTNVAEPLEYIKRICFDTSAYYPVYFFIQQTSMRIPDVIELIEKTTSRGPTKNKLLERVRDQKFIPVNKAPLSKTQVGAEKEKFRQQWLTESIPERIEGLGHCLDALCCLSDEDLINHKQYIRKTMLKIYNEEFAKAPHTLASNIRKTICRIDEALYLEN